MYRMHNVCEVKYGFFAQYAAAMEELNAVARARGWREARVLAPMTGVNNRIVLEIDYDSLEEMQREEEAFYADPEAMKILRSTSDMVVQGTSRTEILSSVPAMA